MLINPNCLKVHSPFNNLVFFFHFRIFSCLLCFIYAGNTSFFSICKVMICDGWKISHFSLLNNPNCLKVHNYDWFLKKKYTVKKYEQYVNKCLKSIFFSPKNTLANMIPLDHCLASGHCKSHFRTNYSNVSSLNRFKMYIIRT